MASVLFLAPVVIGHCLLSVQGKAIRRDIKAQRAIN